MSNELARSFADKIGARVKYAWFPYRPDCIDDCELLKKTSYYKSLCDLWNNIDIAIVGKYVALHDAYLSVAEALKHGGIANRVNVNIHWIEAEEIKKENVHEFLNDMDGILVGIGILAPFGIGVVIGVLAIAKLIEFIFNKFPLYAYWAIIGLIVASPIAIIAKAGPLSFTVVNIVTSLVALCVGTFVAMKLGE